VYPAVTFRDIEAALMFMSVAFGMSIRRPPVRPRGEQVVARNHAQHSAAAPRRTTAIPAGQGIVPKRIRAVRRRGKVTSALAPGPELVDRQHWAAAISMPWLSARCGRK
jgi:hypothetical protein